MPVWLRWILAAPLLIAVAQAATVMPVWTNDTVANTITFNDSFGHSVVLGAYNPATGIWTGSGGGGGVICSQLPALAGDATTPAGSCILTFSTVNANVGTFGSAALVPSFTVNAKGLITGASSAALTGTGTLTSGTASTGFIIQGSNVTWTGSGITAGSGITVGGSWPTQSVAVVAGAATISAPADLTGGTAISSATPKMAGFAGSITPTRSGNVTIAVYGSANNNSAGGQCAMRIRTGTGSAPANGAALTGTAAGTLQTVTGPNAGTPEAYALTVVVTGLSVGVARWIDISVNSDGVVVCSLFANSVSAMEN